MGKTYGIGTHFIDKVVIREMLFFSKRRSVLEPILMAAYTSEFEKLAIEEEAFVRIYPEITDADFPLMSKRLFILVSDYQLLNTSIIKTASFRRARTRKYCHIQSHSIYLS